VVPLCRSADMPVIAILHPRRAGDIAFRTFPLGVHSICLPAFARPYSIAGGTTAAFYLISPYAAARSYRVSYSNYPSPLTTTFRLWQTLRGYICVCVVPALGGKKKAFDSATPVPYEPQHRCCLPPSVPAPSSAFVWAFKEHHCKPPVVRV